MKQRIFISSVQRVGLAELEFTMTDGFDTTIRHKPELAFLSVGGVLQPELQSDFHPLDFFTGTKSGPSRDQADIKLALSGNKIEILHKCWKDSAIRELMELIGRSDRTKFRHQVLKSLLEDGLLDLTVLDKPTSSLQKYRLNEKGKIRLNAMIPKGDGA